VSNWQEGFTPLAAKDEDSVEMRAMANAYCTLTPLMLFSL